MNFHVTDVTESRPVPNELTDAFVLALQYGMNTPIVQVWLHADYEN